VQLVGVEAAGKGLDSGEHAASICAGRPGILHGCKTYLLQDPQGQILDTYSVSAGLDYPGVGPEHSFFADCGKAKYYAVTDAQAIEAFDMLAKFEGIIPALESAHALAYAIARAKKSEKDELLLVNLSGRGDKDMDNVRRYRQELA
jgi:tryptophan synthase beta chain